MLNIPLITMLFIGVNLDFFIILLFLMNRFSFKKTFFGYELGMLIIFIISALAGQTIQVLMPSWLIGVLGLIPIFMGIKGESDNDEDDAPKHSTKGLLAVTLVYVSTCGADNIAVYVPVLATLTFVNLLMTAIYFIILTALSLLLANYVRQLPFIQKIFEKWGAPISRLVYILIGMFVMLDTGFIQHLWSLL